MGLWRFQVSPRPELPDPVGSQTMQVLRDFGILGVRQVRSSRLYLVGLPPDATKLETESARRIANELLTDPVAEECLIARQDEAIADPDNCLPIEVHFKPGVMDNVANSTLLALADMGIRAQNVRTAVRYELSPPPSDSELRRIPRLVGNDCIQEVVIGSRPIQPPPSAPRYEYALKCVSIRNLDSAALEKLSRNGHLFLSLAEMQAVQQHFIALSRDPTDLELETIAQTWSEHCVHKTLKSAFVYRGAPMPNARDHSDIELAYDNLLKDTIARATAELMAAGRGPECLSVFKDNAGIIGFSVNHAIAFKVETHNHPSAIEPYGGAATGVGGVIRDVLGCGLGAKPVANTDVFCVAPPDWPVDQVPKGVIHPRSVLKGVASGVRDYGNRMGIPTVNGAVHFDPRYLGNPLVFCGCVGLIPRNRIEKKVRPGDTIVVVGGRTGRDGIHGATFSSVELTDTHEDEFAHAVQIGNAIEEKKVLDFVVRAREFVGKGGPARCLFSSITDCGAGGLSSAVGEMAEGSGAVVDLEKVPLKYAGLRYDEIWISESQERMVLAVPPEELATLLSLAAAEEVEATAIGAFNDTGHLVVRYQGHTVGDIDLKFLHHGIPRTQLRAEWHPRAAAGASAGRIGEPTVRLVDELQRRLADPTVASKHWLVHQYDHEVQGGSVIKPLAGNFEGPSDAAVVRPRLDLDRGIAIGCGLCPELGDIDPYWMAVAAIDEALRNVVCVGGDPAATAILDNFCWPRVDNPRNLGALVRTCQACYDTAKAYGLPFISGKDSLNNEFALDAADVNAAASLLPPGAIQGGRLAIPCTLLISAISVIDDVQRCITMDLKQASGELFLIGHPILPGTSNTFDFDAALKTHQAVARLIREKIICAAHDVSDGGLLVAIAEMCIASGKSARITTDKLPLTPDALLSPLMACYVVEPRSDRLDDFRRAIGDIPVSRAATFETPPAPAHAHIRIDAAAPPQVIALSDLTRAWKRPLDW